MERITVPGPDGGFSVPAGLEREAAERLGQKTAQFRELFAEKLTIQNTLTLWETYGIH